jgi:hypothetical protein
MNFVRSRRFLPLLSPFVSPLIRILLSIRSLALPRSLSPLFPRIPLDITSAHPPIGPRLFLIHFMMPLYAIHFHLLDVFTIPLLRNVLSPSFSPLTVATSAFTAQGDWRSFPRPFPIYYSPFPISTHPSAVHRYIQMHRHPPGELADLD